MSCLTIKLGLLQLATFWLFCVSEYLDCSLARMQAWRCLCHLSMASSITIWPLQLTLQSDHVSNHSYLYICLIDSLLIYAPNFVVNWNEIMHGCSAATNLAWWVHGGWLHSALRTVSLRTLQTNIAAYDTHFRGLRETLLFRYLACWTVG